MAVNDSECVCMCVCKREITNMENGRQWKVKMFSEKCNEKEKNGEEGRRSIKQTLCLLYFLNKSQGNTKVPN